MAASDRTIAARRQHRPGLGQHQCGISADDAFANGRDAGAVADQSTATVGLDGRGVSPCPLPRWISNQVIDRDGSGRDAVESSINSHVRS